MNLLCGVTSNGISENIPKAPKFRRGSGIKDKWRESWSQSKTLSKTNMEEENRLLRWFSLRKNQSGSSNGGHVENSVSMNNRNSTLPLLSEEDLKRISFMEDEEGYWPRRTVLPPTLPVPPTNLTSEQITRRHIVAAIVHSENNYVAALQRLVNVSNNFVIFNSVHFLTNIGSINSITSSSSSSFFFQYKILEMAHVL